MAKAQLTQRDLNLLQCLHAFGVVTSDQLTRFFFPGVARTTVLRRLRRLELDGYIRKRGNLQTAMAVWMIEAEGQKVLGHESFRTTFPIHQLEHEVTLSEIRWRLQKLGSCLSWMPERDLRRAALRNAQDNRKSIVVPDGLALLRSFLGKERMVKIEAELHPKSRVRYAVFFKKFDPYRKGGNVFTWYFVRKDAIGRKILAYAKKYCRDSLDHLIGYTVIDDFLKNPGEAKLVKMNGVTPLAEVLALPAQGPAQGLSREKTANPKSIAA